MRIRVVISGIVSGLFCLTALWFPWYMVEPAGFVPDWIFQSQAGLIPPWFQTAVYVFCALTIFSLGWVAARWNWSKTWRSSLLAGAGSGLIAGCIIYDFIGAFRFGLLGQADILKAVYRDVGETEGLVLLLEAINGSANLIYLNFIGILFACTAIGALGGLASTIDLEDVWGKPPRDPDRWLSRLPAYTLTLTGHGCLIVLIAVITLLQESVSNIAIEENLTGLKMPPTFISVVSCLACLVFIFPPIGLTWGWMFRAWKRAGLWKFFHITWIGLTVLLVGWLFNGFIRYVASAFLFDAMGPFPYMFIWLVVIGSLGLGFLAGWLSDDSPSSGDRMNFYDWLGYVLTQGILGGTQAFMSITAYSLVLVLVTIENIPHLTQTGTVDLSPSQQVAQLFNVMAGIAQAMVIISAVGGWFFALIVLLFRKFLKIHPVQPKMENDAHLFPA